MNILKKEDLLRIGFVNKTSGFKGNLSCVIDIARPEKLLRKKFLFLLLEGLPVPFAIEKIELSGDFIVVKFEDVGTEEQAKKLIRKEIYADKIRADKKDDYFSWNEIIGYKVSDSSHGEIGIVEDVIEYPMQFIAKCNHNGKEILFPLNDEVVKEINDKKKMVFVELPEGLVELYLG